MAHNPKLEIFRLHLFEKASGAPITIRQFLQHKFNRIGRRDGKTFTKKDILTEFYSDLINRITNAYHLSDKRKKGFKAAMDPAAKNDKTLINFGLDSEVIKGRIKGGTHNRIGFLGNVKKAKQDQNVGKDNIFGYDFYFAIHTPLDHDEAIVFIQGYSGMTISDVFRDFLLDYFKYSKIIKSKISTHVPEKLKNDFMDEAVFKGIEFTSGWEIDPDTEKHIQRKYQVEVKISIVDKSDKKTEPEGFAKIYEAFQQGVFSLGGKKPKDLKDFAKKPKMISDGKSQPIDFIDPKRLIKPVLYLDRVGVKVLDGSVPDFAAIEAYCDKLLPDILNETRSYRNGIKDV